MKIASPLKLSFLTVIQLVYVFDMFALFQVFLHEPEADLTNVRLVLLLSVWIFYCPVTFLLLKQLVKDQKKGTKWFSYILGLGMLIGASISFWSYGKPTISDVATGALVGFWNLSPLVAWICAIPEQIRMWYAHLTGKYVYLVTENTCYYLKNENGQYASHHASTKTGTFFTECFDVIEKAPLITDIKVMLEWLQRNNIYYIDLT
jgi:hypothetical protein